MHTVLANWAPPEERSKLGSIMYNGGSFGTAATMVVSGYLIEGGMMGGWPSVFYIMGIVSIVWFVFWALFMYETPRNHPDISKQELEYIENSIGAQSKKVAMPIPWKAILTSWPLWAIVVGHTGHTWGLYTLLTMLPTYFKTVLHFDIKQNSWMSSIPYFFLMVTSVILPQIADTIISKKWFKIITVRKVFQAIGHVPAGLLLIAASYSGCDRVSTIILLTLAVGFNGAIFAGFGVNHMDISPNFAGVLMGISNTFSNFCGFAAPYVAGSLINNDPSLQNWQYVFYISAAVYFINVSLYAIFASATEQKWNGPTVSPEVIQVAQNGVHDAHAEETVK